MSRNRTLRILEFAFLIAGLAAIDYYIWSGVNAKLYQAYENWKFDKARQEQRQQQAEAPPSSQPSPPAPVKRRHETNELVGRLEIPRLRLAAIVREGVDQGTLEKAVGHIPSTAWPGEPGNAALAGHRDTFFRALRNIKKNDRIVVSTLDGDYQYQVQSTKIVMPSDVGVLKPTGGGNELTLVTCYPFYYVGSAPKRFIVHATQVASTPPRQQSASSISRPG
ncbi:MAG TPA: class D sortase [Bryobacteraceae bacterium]|nr:class D sortase [Bryobacteraceae bacterium]